MKISIIIPVYNVEAYLRECLDSVLVDNAFTGQVVCVNDGSTDGSMAILEEYKKKYPNVEVYEQANQGQSVARNTGLDKAKGEYVLFLDSDDYYTNGAIAYVTKLAKDNPEVDVFYMDCAITTNGKRFYTLHHPEPVKMSLVAYYDYEYSKQSSSPQGCVCGGFYKREFLERNHLRMLPGYRFEDELYVMEMFTKEGICMALHVEEPYYTYRVGREGATTAHHTLKHFMERRTIAHKCYELIRDVDLMTDARKKKVFMLIAENLMIAYYKGFRSHISEIITKEDLRIMNECVTNEHDKKLCKIGKLSPVLLAKYWSNEMSPIARRLINRFV